jgi:quercetin dioxygenase-like cupin family protein
MRLLSVALTLALSMDALAAQDPVTTLPDSYSKQFENEWVRVVRVHYAPYAKLPAHAHTALPSAYVYLNDGGPVLFRHIGTKYGPSTRPPTKAGGFRVFRGLDEMHEVENMSDLPSEFLRVEFKTEPADVKTLRGRFFREEGSNGKNLEKIQFENGQIRITRVICAPGSSVRFSAGTSEPALLIALSAARLQDSGGAAITFRPGQERWIPAHSVHVLENIGPDSSEFLRFDFKTAPI